MRAVVFGAGRIGCGLVGRLLRQAGHEVIFVCRSPDLARHLQRVGRYQVRLVWGPDSDEHVVDGIEAVAAHRSNQVLAEVAAADLVATAVGAGNLAAVAPIIAAGLARKDTTANVIAFENLLDAGGYLADRVAAAMREAPQALEHGFSGGLVYGAISQRLGDPNGHRPLTFVGEPGSTFVVDGRYLRPCLPQLEGMIVAHDYPAWVRRKLYTYSAGHAATAYLGHLKGYHYIHTAIRDPEIRWAVVEAMTEGQQGLAACHGRSFAGGPQDLAAIVARFENAGLNDPIERVGRDPRRKLRVGDRLMGAAHLAEEAGVRPEKLALAAAAALLFSPTDPAAGDLQRDIATTGLASALEHSCGIDVGVGAGRWVAELWQRMIGGWEPGNLLLHLEPILWAWQSGLRP